MTNRGITARASDQLQISQPSATHGAKLSSEDLANVIRFSQDYCDTLAGRAPGKFLSAETCEYFSGWVLRPTESCIVCQSFTRWTCCWLLYALWSVKDISCLGLPKGWTSLAPNSVNRTHFEKMFGGIHKEETMGGMSHFQI